MNCEQIELWISLYQDSELEPHRRPIVAAHLEKCAACRELLYEWSSMEPELRASLAYEEPPEWLHERVMRRLPEPEPALLRTAGRQRRPSPRRFTFGLVPISAALAWVLMAHHPSSPRKLPAHPEVSPASRLAINLPPTERSGSRLLPDRGSGQPITKRPRRGVPLSGPETTIRHGQSVPSSAQVKDLRKAQGRHPFDEEKVLHHLRGLRTRRRRYVLAAWPREESGGSLRPSPLPPHHRRRHPSMSFRIVSRPSPAPADTAARQAAGPPQIAVVDYVLPQIPPTSAVAGSEPTVPQGDAANGTELAYSF